ncbi:hypothetical protein [Acidithiobacillus ferriphilus]|jgi:hypothetical protein|nr:hypothetical protein [Acidithiobacillus ferriphilus]
MMKKLALPVVLFTLAGCSSIDQDPQGGHDVFPGICTIRKR